MPIAQQLPSLLVRIALSIRARLSFVFALINCVDRYRISDVSGPLAGQNVCLIALFDQLSALIEQAFAPLVAWGGPSARSSRRRGWC
jgi:hypothetical protein